jgi:hypothetical protein
MITPDTTRRALGALLLVAIAATPACAVSRRPPASMDTTTCGAIAAAIDSLVVGSNAVRVGLRDETTPSREQEPVPDSWKSLADMPGLDGTTLRSFRENNARPLPACATLPLVGGMTLLARGELDALPTRDADAYWRAFHARFPGVAGLTSTSGVGISRDGRQALLVLDHSCGGICGTGHIVLLERDDAGKWRVRRAVMTWIS